ncbi:MAG: NERD domain-containing protein [Thermoplasmata archaeon]|nr:NERD domain-containing protein [Thermoplasmata archaeon]
MAIEFFSSGEIDFNVNERRQYERIKKKLIGYFSSKNQRYYVIVDYVVGNKQYDLIFIKNDAIVSIDMKGYKGKIYGTENGVWYVELENGEEREISQSKNPFRQAREQRYRLISLINEKLPKISDRFKGKTISHISSVICFEEGSSYDIEQIDYHSFPWFNVTDEAHLPEVIDHISSNEFYLKDTEINILLEELNLKKLENEVQKRKLNVSAKSTLHSEDIEIIAGRIFEDFGYAPFDLEELSHIVDPEIAARFIEDALGMNILKKDRDPHKFSLTKNWLSNIPKTEIDEELYSISEFKRYSSGDFWLKPNKAEKNKEYMGVYRGTTYHFDYKGDVWWRANRANLKIKATFSDSKIIDDLLDVKPQGGSFRITESREVLTKVFIEGRGYVSIYIGNLVGDIELEHFRWQPEKIKRGDLWPSIYDGTTFSVNTNGELLLHIGGNKVYAIEGHENLVKKVLDFTGKYGGGRFKINENGNIIALMYHAPYPDRIKRQLEQLSSEEKNLIDIRRRTNLDERVPIYIGKYKGNIKFQRMFDLHRRWSDEEDEEFLRRLGS